MKIKRFLDPFILLSKAERNGAIVLLIIIGVLMITRILLPRFFKPGGKDIPVLEKRLELVQKQNDSLDALQPKKKKSYSNYPDNSANKEKRIEYKDFQRSPSVLFVFDPNNVTLTEMDSLGFSKYAAQNLINYREKGGKFYKPEDVKKIYGVDSALFAVLLPYITVESASKQKILLELNSSDSISLIALNGIGPKLASRICKYRKQLGGFVRLEQLKEVYQFSDETYNAVIPSLTVDPNLAKKINVNFADINEMKNHPYIDYKMARKIVDYRSSKGFIKSVDVLLRDSILDQQAYDKIHAYLKIE